MSTCLFCRTPLNSPAAQPYLTRGTNVCLSCASLRVAMASRTPEARTWLLSWWSRMESALRASKGLDG